MTFAGKQARRAGQASPADLPRGVVGRRGVPCTFLSVALFCGFLGATSLLPAQETPAQEAKPRSSRAAAAAYASAAAMQQQGLFDLAATEWQALITAFPDDPAQPRARYNLGVCQFQQAKYQAAATEFAAVADPQAYPEVAEAALANLGLARFNIARSAAKQPAEQEAGGQAYEAAISAFDKLLANYPVSDQTALAHYYRGEASAAVGKYAQAAMSFTKLVRSYALSPLAPAGRLGLGEAWLELGKLKEAEQELTTLIETTAGDSLEGEEAILAEAHRTRGEVRLAAANFKGAAQDFAAAADAPDVANPDEARQRQAYCLFKSEDFSGAAAAYDQLVADWPESPLVTDAKLSAAKSMLSAGEAKAAADRFETLWREDPTASNAAAAHWFARAAISAGGLTADPLPVVEAALATKPKAPWVAELSMDRADLLYRDEDQRAVAMELYAGIAKENSSQPLGQRAAGLAAQTALEVGQSERAIELAQQALEQGVATEFEPDLRQVIAEATRNLGQHAKAAQLYRGLMQKFPDSNQQSVWALRLAQCLADDGQWQKAAGVLEPLVGELSGAQFATGALLLAKAQAKQGATPAAVETLTRLIESNPEPASLAQALYQRGRLVTTQASDRDYRRLIEQFPGNPLASYARLGLAGNQFGRGDHQAAAATLAPLARGSDDKSLSGQANFLLANAQLELKDYAAALKAIRSAEGPEAEKLYLKGVCESRLGQDAAAQQTLEACLAAEDAAAVADRALYELAWIQTGDDKTAKSNALFARLVKEHPKSPFTTEANYRIGASQYEAKQFDAAARSLQTAIESEPQQGNAGVREQAMHLLAWVRFDSGDHNAAVQAFRDQLEACPSGKLAADARVMLAEGLFAQEKFSEALPEYRAALQDKDLRDDLRVLALLHAGQAAGQLASSSEQWQAAYKLLDEARQLAGHSPYATEIAYERAWALSKLGKTEESQAEFEQLASSATGVLSARSRFVLGELQFAQKEYEEAVRTFFKVAYGYGGQDAPPEFHPWQSEAMFEAARCLEELDRRRPARKLYVELLERFPDSEKAPHARRRLQPTTSN